MKPIRLESNNPETNRARFYVLAVPSTLWGSWALFRRWGRIDEQARGAQVDECATQEEALRRAAGVVELRIQHKCVVK